MTGDADWEAWLAGLDAATSERARALLAKFRAAGCIDDPEGWVRSEIDEDFAQLARFVLLRALWARELEPWRGHERQERWGLANEVVHAGADVAKLRLLCANVAYSTAFDILYLLDEGSDNQLNGDFPQWRLVEIDPTSGEPTGRAMDALHESLMEVDPTRTEAQDFLG